MSGIFLAASERDPTRIVAAIRDLFMGRSNAMGEFTLTAGGTTTLVTAINCGEQSTIAITPRTANAAAALATTYITAANTLPGKFTVTHANTGTTDRIFAYSING